MLQDRDPPLATVLSNKRIRAKKKHECDCTRCKRPIEIGMSYYHVVYLDEDNKFHCKRFHLSHGDDDLIDFLVSRQVFEQSNGK